MRPQLPPNAKDAINSAGDSRTSKSPDMVRFRRRIYVSDGSWWFSDPLGKGNIRLEPLFHQSGWNLGRLSSLLGIGNRTLARLIEESIGISGKLWLRQNRIVTACHLLRESEKIEPLAKSLGFSQHADFTREFKKMVGVLPSEFIARERIGAGYPPN